MFAETAIALGDVCTIIDCEHKTAPTEDTGIPLIRTPNIGRGRLILEGVQRISESTFKIWTRRGAPEPGDLIMAREAPVGNVAIVPPNARVCLGQRTVLIRVKDPKVDSNYLNYLLSSSAMNVYLNLLSNGATVGHLNVTDIRRLKLPGFPSMASQRKIAAVLSAYDELMENNRRRIALLEKLAEEIYREWFVRLRFPGHEKVKLVKGIPAEWEVKKLGELVRTQYGFTASAEAEGHGPKFLRITDIVPAAIDWEGVPHCKIDENLEEKYLLHEGDIVVARTGATVGYAKRINKLHPKAVFASYLVRLIPNRQVDSVFLGLAVERTAFKDFITMFVTGAAQPQANATTMALFPVLHPPESLLIEFNEIAQPILDQKEILLNQIAMLAHTRDLLLPRLISGKLSVEDLDIQFPPGMVGVAKV